MSQVTPQTTGVFRLDRDVRPIVDEVCRKERRSVSNTVNLLVIEALTARGLWPAATTHDTTEAPNE
jgi:hypothetical protein